MISFIITGSFLCKNLITLSFFYYNVCKLYILFLVLTINTFFYLLIAKKMPCFFFKFGHPILHITKTFYILLIFSFMTRRINN